MRAFGFTFAAFASIDSIAFGSAESHLLMRMMSARRKFASPGWYDISWPGRSGSAMQMWMSGR